MAMAESNVNANREMGDGSRAISVGEVLSGHNTCLLVLIFPTSLRFLRRKTPHYSIPDRNRSKSKSKSKSPHLFFASTSSTLRNHRRKVSMSHKRSRYQIYIDPISLWESAATQLDLAVNSILPSKRTSAPDMAAETCDHTTPPLLKEKPNDWDKLEEPNKCPTCLVRSRIAEIKEIQAGFESRGGILKSKTKIKFDSKWMSHNDWKTRWRLAKTRFQRKLELLEEFKYENPELADECGVYHALQVYNLEAEDCSLVPGSSYVSSKQVEVQEVKMGVAAHEESSMSAHDRVVQEDLSLSAQETQDLWADGREWVIKPKRKSQRLRVVEDKPNLGSILAASASPLLDDITTADEEALEEMEAVTTRSEKRGSPGS